MQSSGGCPLMTLCSGPNNEASIDTVVSVTTYSSAGASASTSACGASGGIGGHHSLPSGEVGHSNLSEGTFYRVGLGGAGIGVGVGLGFGGGGGLGRTGIGGVNEEVLWSPTTALAIAPNTANNEAVLVVGQQQQPSSVTAVTSNLMPLGANTVTPGCPSLGFSSIHSAVCYPFSAANYVYGSSSFQIFSPDKPLYGPPLQQPGQATATPIAVATAVPLASTATGIIDAAGIATVGPTHDVMPQTSPLCPSFYVPTAVDRHQILPFSPNHSLSPNPVQNVAAPATIVASGMAVGSVYPDVQPKFCDIRANDLCTPCHNGPTYDYYHHGPHFSTPCEIPEREPAIIFHHSYQPMCPLNAAANLQHIHHHHQQHQSHHQQHHQVQHQQQSEQQQQQVQQHHELRPQQLVHPSFQRDNQHHSLQQSYQPHMHPQHQLQHHQLQQHAPQGPPNYLSKGNMTYVIGNCSPDVENVETGHTMDGRYGSKYLSISESVVGDFLRKQFLEVYYSSLCSDGTGNSKVLRNFYESNSVCHMGYEGEKLTVGNAETLHKSMIEQGFQPVAYELLSEVIVPIHDGYHLFVTGNLFSATGDLRHFAHTVILAKRRRLHVLFEILVFMKNNSTCSPKNSEIDNNLIESQSTVQYQSFPSSTSCSLPPQSPLYANYEAQSNNNFHRTINMNQEEVFSNCHSDLYSQHESSIKPLHSTHSFPQAAYRNSAASVFPNHLTVSANLMHTQFNFFPHRTSNSSISEDKNFIPADNINSKPCILPINNEHQSINQRNISYYSPNKLVPHITISNNPEFAERNHGSTSLYTYEGTYNINSNKTANNQNITGNNNSDFSCCDSQDIVNDEDITIHPKTVNVNRNSVNEDKEEKNKDYDYINNNSTSNNCNNNSNNNDDNNNHNHNADNNNHNHDHNNDHNNTYKNSHNKLNTNNENNSRENNNAEESTITFDHIVNKKYGNTVENNDYRLNEYSSRQLSKDNYGIIYENQVDYYAFKASKNMHNSKGNKGFSIHTCTPTNNKNEGKLNCDKISYKGSILVSNEDSSNSKHVNNMNVEDPSFFSKTSHGAVGREVCTAQGTRRSSNGFQTIIRTQQQLKKDKLSNYYMVGDGDISCRKYSKFNNCYTYGRRDRKDLLSYGNVYGTNRKSFYYVRKSNGSNKGETVEAVTESDINWRKTDRNDFSGFKDMEKIKNNDNGKDKDCEQIDIINTSDNMTSTVSSNMKPKFKQRCMNTNSERNDHFKRKLGTNFRYNSSIIIENTWNVTNGHKEDNNGRFDKPNNNSCKNANSQVEKGRKKKPNTYRTYNEHPFS